MTGSATATVAPEDVRETELACFCALKPVVDLDWDPHAAFTQLELFRSGIEPNLRAEVQALPSAILTYGCLFISATLWKGPCDRS